jgi:hypothetical protein
MQADPFCFITTVAHRHAPCDRDIEIICFRILGDGNMDLYNNRFVLRGSSFGEAHTAIGRFCSDFERQKQRSWPISRSLFEQL